MRHTQLWFITIIILTLLGIGRIVANQKISDEEYAWQVVDQFRHYLCPRAGVCTQQEALNHLREDWPTIYQAGFSVLERPE